MSEQNHPPEEDWPQRGAFRHLQLREDSHCPPAEQLRLYAEGKLRKKERKQLESHLERCPMCLEAVSHLRQAAGAGTQLPEREWEQSEKAMDEKVYSGLQEMPIPPLPQARPSLLRRLKRVLSALWPAEPARRTRLVLAAVSAAVVLAIGGTYLSVLMTRPAYWALAQVQKPELATLRGTQAAPPDFQRGLSLLEHSRYSGALRQFQKMLQQNPEDYLANYYAGLSLLLAAQKRRLGLVAGFDRARAEQSLPFLQKALEVSGENPYYREDALWLLGKAYLMLGRLRKARAQFQQITAMTTPDLVHKREAAKILAEIQSLLPAE